jgi:acyl-CoA thioester hydrolase
MSLTAPLPLMEARVKPEWVDFNGHMNDAAYAAAFSDALMVMTDRLGLDAEGRARTGHTIYTLAMMIRYLNEAALDAPIVLRGRILEADDRRIRVWGEMHHGETGMLLATTEQLLLCVDQSGPAPRASRWPESFAVRLEWLSSEHASLPVPEGAGEGIRLKRKTA